MHHNEIAKIFLKYFQKHQHLLIESSSLVPKEIDPSALFINSGMHPIKNYFLGVEQPPSKRLCSLQRVFRTIDIDNVGGNARTLTFFFMLGSWSIGDYWKKDAAKLAYDLLVKEYGFEKEKLWMSVFEGDSEVQKDTETLEAWKKIGVNHIVELGEKHNFWKLGDSGPCGPSTEIYYDQGKEAGCGKKD